MDLHRFPILLLPETEPAFLGAPARWIGDAIFHLYKAQWKPLLQALGISV